MTTFAINFTDFTGNFWSMDWTPTTAKNKPLAESDVQAVVTFIKTGTWPKTATVAAKNCYDNLAAQIATTIVKDATDSEERTHEIIRAVAKAWSDEKFSKQGNKLFDDCIELASKPKTAETTSGVRKIIKKIIKSENLFAVKFAEDENWLVEVMTEMTCCICGKTIADNNQGHDPYPVRPESWYGEKENRCCPECNNRIVLPIRLKHGRHANKCRSQLLEMNYEELIDFAPKVRIPTLEEVQELFKANNKLSA